MERNRMRQCALVVAAALAIACVPHLTLAEEAGTVLEEILTIMRKSGQITEEQKKALIERAEREAKQAQAERERQSRIILGTAETEIAEKFAAASASYRNNPVALHLRAMNMVYEGLKQKGSMIIVPSTAVETMGLGALGGLTAFGQQADEPQVGAAAEVNAPGESRQ